MRDFYADLRFGIRLLRRSPVFTLTAGLLLAIGICANTLLFSAFNALMLRPLPVAHPENLVRLVELHPNNFVTWSLPYDFCAAAATRDSDLAEVICEGEADVAFRSGSSAERVRVHLVSPNFFSSLGVKAWLGRGLTPEDERRGSPFAVASYNFWRKSLGADRAAIGRSVTLGGHPFTIVGVSAEGFNGLAADTTPDLRVPASTDRLLVKPSGDMSPASRPLFAQVFGRLRVGVTFARANANLDPLLAEAYQEESEKIYPPVKGTVRAKGPLDSHLRLEAIAGGVSTLRAQFSRGLEVLMAGVALLLLMVCANVAGLLLARAARRGPEMGVRLALGGSAGRIVRQLLTEGLVLAALGGAAGIVLTAICLPLLTQALPPLRDRGAVLQPLAVHMGIDIRVLAFTVGVTALTAVLFALPPALRLSRASVAEALRGTRTTTGRLPGRRLIVAAQVALCTLILMGAWLLGGTLRHMRTMNPGFDRDRVVTLTIDPSLNGYTDEQCRLLSKTLLERSAALPDVEAAGIASRALMRGTGVKATFGLAGARIASSDFLNSSLNDVSPGYFQTMGMKLLAGRPFDARDEKQKGPHVAIVNQAFVRRFLAGHDALGKQFGFPGAGGIATADSEIVGVVTDAKYRSLREPIPPTVYRPMQAGADGPFILHVRTRGPAGEAIAPLRAILRELDPALPVIEAQSLGEEVEASLWQERLLASLASVFSAIAALVAGIGLYGALDFAVKSRRREVGVRMALGARPARIAGLFSREAAALTSAGMVLGFAGHALASTWIRHLLYGLRAWEQAAVVQVAVLVAVLAACAAAPAIYRAVRTDPAPALRTE